MENGRISRSEQSGRSAFPPDCLFAEEIDRKNAGKLVYTKRKRQPKDGERPRIRKQGASAKLLLLRCLRQLRQPPAKLQQQGAQAFFLFLLPGSSGTLTGESIGIEHRLSSGQKLPADLTDK